MIFNDSPIIERIIGGIILITMGIVGGIAGLNFAFSGEWGVLFGVVYGLMMALGALFFVSVGWATLTNVEKLVIDFSQQTYELHREGPPRVDQAGTVQEDLPLHKTGNLREISHLRLRCFYQPGNRRVSGYHVVQVSMVWKNDHPKEFILKYDTPMFRKERAKTKLKAYAEELAARLEVPVK